MLAIHHGPHHTKGFYITGAALIAFFFIMIAIRLHPSFDFSLFKPVGSPTSDNVSKDNPNQGANGGATGSSSRQSTGSSKNTSSSGKNGGSVSQSSPQQIGSSTTPIVSGSAPSGSTTGPIASGPVASSGGGSGGGSLPSSGEPDGDEGLKLGLPPVNVSPTVGVGLPSL